MIVTVLLVAAAPDRHHNFNAAEFHIERLDGTLQPMNLKSLPLADIVADDPLTEIVEDHRERFGYVVVQCPNDDGTSDHALIVSNAREGSPANAYCMAEKCKDVTADEFAELLGIRLRLN